MDSPVLDFINGVADLQGSRVATLSKKDPNTSVSCEYCKMFKSIIYFDKHLRTIASEFLSQPAFTCSKLTISFTPCSSVYIVNFEHVIAGWGENESLTVNNSLNKTNPHYNRNIPYI